MARDLLAHPLVTSLQVRAERWAAAMHYPRELTDEVARGLADADAVMFGGDVDETRGVYVAAARAAIERFAAANPTPEA